MKQQQLLMLPASIAMHAIEVPAIVLNFEAIYKDLIENNNVSLQNRKLKF